MTRLCRYMGCLTVSGHSEGLRRIVHRGRRPDWARGFPLEGHKDGKRSLEGSFGGVSITTREKKKLATRGADCGSCGS